jgi:hypothetical protein
MPYWQDALIDPNRPRWTGFLYANPNTTLQNLVTSIAASGDILPITPPAPNSSWRLSFDGPGMKCADLNEDMVNILVRELEIVSSDPVNWVDYEYFAWYPNETNAFTGSTTNPFSRKFRSIDNPDHSIFNLAFDPGALVAYESGKDLSYQAQVMEIDIGIVPKYINASWEIGFSNGPSDADTSKNAKGTTFLQCRIFNTTYHVNFL